MRGDHQLIQIVDVALGEAARKAGAWLACRPGCYPCCDLGVQFLQPSPQALRIAGVIGKGPRQHW